MYHFEEKTIFESSQRTSDEESAVIDVSKFSEVTFFLDITNQGSYTDETLDILILSYDPASKKYIEIGKFTQVTGDKSSGFQDDLIISAGLGSKIKVKADMNGTSTDYTFSVGAVFKRII